MMGLNIGATVLHLIRLSLPKWSLYAAQCSSRSASCQYSQLSLYRRCAYRAEEHANSPLLVSSECLGVIVLREED